MWLIFYWNELNVYLILKNHPKSWILLRYMLQILFSVNKCPLSKVSFERNGYSSCDGLTYLGTIQRKLDQKQYPLHIAWLILLKFFIQLENHYIVSIYLEIVLNCSNPNLKWEINYTFPDLLKKGIRTRVESNSTVCWSMDPLFDTC